MKPILIIDSGEVGGFAPPPLHFYIPSTGVTYLLEIAMAQAIPRPIMLFGNLGYYQNLHRSLH